MTSGPIGNRTPQSVTKVTNDIASSAGYGEDDCRNSAAETKSTDFLEEEEEEKKTRDIKIGINWYTALNTGTI